MCFKLRAVMYRYSMKSLYGEFIVASPRVRVGVHRCLRNEGAREKERER